MTYATLKAPAAASAAASLSVYLYPFPGLRAGDAGRCRTDLRACVSWEAYGAVQSLSRRDGVRVLCGWRLRVWQCHRARNEVERGCGGGLVCGGGGLWSAAEGRPRAPWSSGRDRREGWEDGLRGLGRDGPKE